GPARGEDVPVQAGGQPYPGRGGRPLHGDARRPEEGRGQVGRDGRRGAQGGEEGGPAGARPGGPALPGLRRHRARGLLRRLRAPVLPDLPDRRQTTGRPPDVAAAEVAPASTSGRSVRMSDIKPKVIVLLP